MKKEDLNLDELLEDIRRIKDTSFYLFIFYRSHKEQ